MSDKFRLLSKMTDLICKEIEIGHFWVFLGFFESRYRSFSTL